MTLYFCGLNLLFNLTHLKYSVHTISDSPNSTQLAKQEPSITEIMKSPSKVVLLRVRFYYLYYIYFLVLIIHDSFKTKKY